MSSQEKALASGLSRLIYANPFLPERIDVEREILGSEFVDMDPVLSLRGGVDPHDKNIQKISDRAEILVDRLRERLNRGDKVGPEASSLYEDVVNFHLFHRYRDRYSKVISEQETPRRFDFYSIFLEDLEHYLNLPSLSVLKRDTPEHLFAFFFQIRRAFDQIFHFIIGKSMASAKLRACIWQSIFSHDGRRYQKNLYRRMGDFTTLVTGPSGTGKELVARAIALSRYIPFDEKTKQFKVDYRSSFYPVNLSALSPQLIESELFGHRKGSFTGALEDRRGWLEVCPPEGTVFMDEIGDLDKLIQVKLLRVLQAKKFQRLGETQDRKFQGKLITATNRDLKSEMERGQFREDFYYRLCSDIVETRSLSEQLSEKPDDLGLFVQFIVSRLIGSEDKTLCEEAEAWIQKNISKTYAWPGNFRELEQCVRNILIRKSYAVQERSQLPPREDFLRSVSQGELKLDEVISRYATLIYSQEGSFERTAERLGVDRRTVKARIDSELLEKLRRRN